MKLSALNILVCITKLTMASVIPAGGFGAYKASQTMQESQTLMEELRSMNIDCEKWSGNKGKSVVFPSEMLTADTMEELGFHKKELVELSLSFGEVVIPQDTAGLFLFNSTDTLIGDSVDEWVPFAMPKYARLVDYHMLMPYSYHRVGTKLSLLQGHENVLEASYDISNSAPLLVLIFQSGNENTAKNTMNLPLVSIKEFAADGDRMISEMFRQLAKKWISILGYRSLVSSTFCSINVSFPAQSACVKVGQDEEGSVTVMPAFFESESIQKRENSEYVMDLHGILDGNAKTHTQDQRHFSNNTETLYKPPLPFKFDGARKNIPLETVRNALDKSTTAAEPARDPAFSQIAIARKTKRDRTEKPGCVPITWYNVFHHSIFGKPKDFCTGQ
ncbi:unnamed protein product [Kuraishia capsulata CBS 1993]|uniref:Uncharacterized protein n=1 Tax=Kuraishia capsulata CBS 1993 TaxID=1382522 RepID=W6MGI1_9ASCO|nr:uncharacterized protein KUCA_T00000883001 [Kuraishia capsulata CBS 1993]CDK24916.1 unnamed protein product [Kuraishia capsulata CBS 1993]